MDDKILISKEEFERLKTSFNRFSDESNLRKQAEEKLKTANNKLAEQHRTEEQLRLLIDSQNAILNNAAYIVVLTDCEGIITTFNPAAERALGYTSEEFVDKLSPVIFHDINEVVERARIFSTELGVPIEPGFDVFAAKARLQLPNEYEWTFIRKDGSRFPVLLSVTALYNQQGNITGFMGIANDITERKQVEEALKKSEAQLNEAQHIAHIGSWELDIVNNILTWSDEIYRMFEIDPEKFGASYEAFLNAIHPDDRDAVNLAYTNSLKTRVPYEIDHRLLFADGRIKYVHEQCESFYDADGKPNRSIGIVTDITERKQSEQKINQLAAIVESSDDAIIGKNMDGIVSSWNKGAEKIYGYTENEMIGQSISILLLPGRPDEVQQIIEKIKAGEHFAHYETMRRRKDGKDIHVALTISPIRDSEGGIVAVSTIARDITERKEAEDALRAASLYARSLIEASIDPLVTISADGTITDVNQATESVTGVPRERLIGTEFSNYFTEPEKAKVGYQQVLEQGLVRDYPLTIRHMSGNITDVLYNATVYKNETGEIQGVFAAARDISELKQSEEALRESEERYRLVFENSPISIWEEDFSGVKAFLDGLKNDGVTDIETYFFLHPETIRECADLVKIVDVNQAALSLHGAISKEELFAGLVNTFTTESFDSFRKELVCLWNGETEMRIDAAVKTLAGDRRSVTIYFSVCPGYGESLSKVFVSLIDITQRKQTEAALSESEEKYRTLIQKIQTAVVVHGPDTQIITCNAKAQELLGLTEDQLLGKTSIDPAWHFYRENGAILPLAEYPVTRAMTSRQELRNLILGIHRSNKENDVWVLVNADPVLGKEGEITQIIVTFIDITERKQAEVARELSSQRTQSLLQLNQMTEATLKEITDFTLQEAVRLTQSKIGYLAFLNEDESVLTMHSWSKSAMAECDIVEKPILYPIESTGLWGEAVRQRRPVITNDYTSANPLKKGCPEGHVDLRRHMNTPVFDGSRIVIVAGVGNKAEEYDESDVQQLTLIMEGMWRLIERKQAEESQEKERKRMEVLLSALNTGLSLINPDMTIGWVNQKIREMFPGKEPVGQVCHVFYESRATVCDGCGTQQAFVNGKVIESEQFVPSTGRWYYIISLPIKDSTGRVVNVLEGITDITERKEAEQKLKLLNFALNNVYDEAYLINEQACFDYVNDESCKALGYSYEELLGMNVAEVDPDFPLELWAQHWSDLKEHSSIIFESHHKTRDGRIYPVEISANYFEYNDQGYNLAMVRDITERKQSEEELAKHRNHLEALVAERTNQLQESEFYYRRLFETMFQGVVYQDAEGKVISMNPAAELILGKTQSEFLGKTSIYTENQTFKEDGSLFSDEEHPATRALNTGHEVQNVVMKLYNPAVKGYRWISISAMPLFHPDETNPYQVYTLFNDITESKAAEEALRVNEERMRLFFERQLVGMAITSPEKGWIKVNDKICEMLGYSSEELTRLTWSEMTYPEDLAPDVAQFERLLHGEIDGYTLEKRFVRKDGSIVFTNLLVGCVRRPDRSVDYVLAILENITGRKQADEQIQQLNGQLAARAQSLEIANKELEAFSYSVSHDLRAPLRSIDGFSQILLDDYQDKVDEQGKNYLQRVRSATQRMAQLIDDMLTLSRVSRGELNIRQVNLSEIAKEVADELRHNQPEHTVELIIQKGILAQGDPRLLRIVLENLLGNAWKFTSKHASARIEFGMKLQNNLPVYFIRDDGAGFDMNYSQKLFGAFQRLHTVDEFQGTGIGLATVQRVIHRHGGKAWAEGEVEKGATIYFTIA